MNERAEAADGDWEARLAALWFSFDEFDRDTFVAKVEALAGERPPGDAIAFFELAGAYDSTGYAEKAEPNYRAALACGLVGLRRRRAVIQLASTLRNLGQISESIALLSAEREAGSDELDDAVDATLALALADAGQAKRGLSLALTALARHLPRYNRSMANYAKELLNDTASPSEKPTQ